MSRESAELLERDAEIARIEAAIAEACAGTGSSLMIEGPAGIGKTALLRAAVEIAGERMTALSARATELECEFPFGVARQLLEPRLRAAPEDRRSRLLSGAGAHAAPALGLAAGGGGADPGFATLNGLYWLVSDLADEGPLLIIVDDAHWADRDSLRFLSFLAPRLAELPALLILGARPEQWRGPQPLAATASDAGARAVAPAGLTAEACAKLVDAAYDGSVDPAFATACHNATGGNPFYLHALLEELRRDRIAASAQAAERVLGLGPHAVSRVIVARLGALSAAAPRLVAAVAVLGDDSDPAHAAELAELAVGEARAAAAELAEAAILEPAEPLRFAHPIIRNAVYEELGHSERADLHRRAVHLLASEPLAAERVPGHLLAVEPAGDAEVVATLRRAAATSLGRGAIDSAVAYLRRAAAEPPPQEERMAVLAELGQAEAQVLDPKAIGHLEAASAGLSEPIARASALAVLGLARYLQGDGRGAAAALREALDPIPPGSGGDAEAYLLLTWFMAGRAVPELVPELSELLDRSRAGPGGEPTAGEVARTLATVFDAFLRGDRPRALEQLARADELIADLRPSLPVNLMRGAFECVLGLDRRAGASFDASFDRARGRGSPMMMSLALEGRTHLRWITGDLGGAIADAETRLRLGGEEWGPATALVRVMLSVCQVERGELDAAAEALELPNRIERRLRGMWAWLWLPYGRARLAFARERWAEAGDEALLAGERLLAIDAPSPEYVPWRSLAAAALRRLGDVERARELAEEELRLARGAESKRSMGVALVALAEIEAQDSARLELLREAVDLLATTPARLEHARALVELGAALRRSGARAESRGPLAEGMRLASSGGAAPIAERAYTELRAAGARPRKPVRSGVESLTPSELRVARLAARGLTNRVIAEELFVTVKTVEFHLGQAYRKLEISSRDQLEEALAPT